MNREKTPLIKVKFKSYKNPLISAEDAEHNIIFLRCNESQQREMESISDKVYPNNIFNFINVTNNTDHTINAELFILEPDYLIDISSLAECFRPYGNHPLNYTLSRFRSMDNTKHILLGNTANFFLDELINERKDHFAEYNEILRKLFRNYPVEFTACEDLYNPIAELKFFEECKSQFNNIQTSIQTLFPKANIDIPKAILEPSFICNKLGLQGRLDLMLQDVSAFVELKSGKATEDFRSGVFIQSGVNHYIQMILYLAVLEFNLGIEPERINSYLLYSKYPILSKESHSRERFYKAITLRNQIVAQENELRSSAFFQTDKLFAQIQPEILNTSNLSGKFFENYLRPTIDEFKTSITGLTRLEYLYFTHMYLFVVKELWISKLGEREYEGIKRSANLWNTSFEDKIAAGEFLYDLEITRNEALSEKHSICLKIPEYKANYFPNFRQGDAIVLYQKNSDNDSIYNKQVFKGSIEYIDSWFVQIRLRAKQNNISILPLNSKYAIEHDHIDSTYNGMFRSLNSFIHASQSRKDLLLNQRIPVFNNKTPLNANEEKDDIKRIVSKAMRAEDCFILVGPPGTGKTSLALKQLVEACMKKNENILLLSYTNRSVDEICKALITIDGTLNFIRIGNELSCDPCFRKYLLEQQISHCNKRLEVKTILNKCSIFVGTIASVWNKSELFQLKSFNTAIIDEAAQLLEPHLIGILCAKNQNGNDAISRFILIGDHKQLPAVILQSKKECIIEEKLLKEAGLFNLTHSLFERLYHIYSKTSQKQAFDILTKQGRMHPMISGFPSRFFYDGKLDCAYLPHQMEVLPKRKKIDDKWVHLVTKTRLAFISTSVTNENTTDKTNLTEALVIFNIMNAIIQKHKQNNTLFHPDSIGIITPYRNQISLIRNVLLENNISGVSDILIDTVERFQGSQKDIIIYSFCIKNAWQLQTLPCLTEENGTEIDRKLNVALTRAKKQLFIIGNEQLLSRNDLYHKLINHIRENGLFMQA